MILQLVNGSLNSLQAVFGPWLDRVPTIDDYKKAWSDYEKCDLKKDDLDTIAKISDKILRYRANMVFVTSEQYRLDYNKTTDKPMPRTEQLDIITDEMMNAFNTIFESVWDGDLRLAFVLNTDESLEAHRLYITKICKYLQRLAKRETKGVKPEEYTERQLRLMDAPHLAEFYLNQMTHLEAPALPFPTDSMLSRLWECVDGLDDVFREVSSSLNMFIPLALVLCLTNRGVWVSPRLSSEGRGAAMLMQHSQIDTVRCEHTISNSPRLSSEG